MCLKVNIPMHKLDRPAVREYLAKCAPGSFHLPSGDTLKRNCVPLAHISRKRQ